MKSLKDAHERDKLLAQKVSDDLAAKRAHRAAASRRLALIDLLESLCSYPYLIYYWRVVLLLNTSTTTTATATNTNTTPTTTTTAAAAAATTSIRNTYEYTMNDHLFYAYGC